jgi:hypothetical protein
MGCPGLAYGSLDWYRWIAQRISKEGPSAIWKCGCTTAMWEAFQHYIVRPHIKRAHVQILYLPNDRNRAFFRVKAMLLVLLLVHHLGHCMGRPSTPRSVQVQLYPGFCLPQRRQLLRWGFDMGIHS